jgi:hypothetical protein
MADWVKVMLVPATLAFSALWAADSRESLTELEVAGTDRVAATSYGDASALAARGATPLEIALAVVGPFKGARQHIVQVNEGSEAPSASRVTVLRDGLLDDSIRGERWDVVLARSDAGTWRITEVRRAWRCWRGAQSRQFATDRCP